MMSKIYKNSRWFKFHFEHADALRERLDCTEYGAAMILLEKTFYREEFPDDDPDLIAPWLKMTSGRWMKIRDRLLEKKKIKIEGGKIIILGGEELLHQYKEDKECWQTRAKAGGRAKKNQGKKINDINGNALLEARFKHASSSAEEEQETESDKKFPHRQDEAIEKLNHLIGKKPKGTGRALTNWIWDQGDKILMICHGIDKDEARSQIGKLNNQHSKNAAIVADTIVNTAMKFIENRGLSPPGVEGSPQAKLFKLPSESPAGKKYAQEYKLVNNAVPKAENGKYLISRQTYKRLVPSELEAD